MTKNLSTHWSLDDQISAAEWDANLLEFSDANIYQTHAFGEGQRDRARISRIIVKGDSQAIGMAQIRILPKKNMPFGIAHIQWGPICLHSKLGGTPFTLKLIRDALHSEYVTRRKLCLVIQPNCFSGDKKDQLLAETFGGSTRVDFRATQTSRTLIVNLAPDITDIRRELDQKWRNQLNRAEKNGLRISTSCDNEAFQSFSRIHSEMVDRKGISNPTSLQDFEKLLHTRKGIRLFLCHQGDVLVSGAIISDIGDTGLYLFGATSGDGLKAKGAYLIQWSIIQHLKNVGCNFYNLGGINPLANPGVYHFKSGIPSSDLSYSRAYLMCANKFRRIFAELILKRPSWLGSIRRFGKLNWR